MKNLNEALNEINNIFRTINEGISQDKQYTITIKCTQYAMKDLVPLLEELRKLGCAGSSRRIVIEEWDGENKFYFDGDGASHIISIDVREPSVSEDNFTSEQSHNEIIIRKLLTDEQDAVMNYEKAANEIINSEISKVLRDIKREELVHIGELKTLLNLIGIYDDNTDQEGNKEVLDLVNEENITEAFFTQEDLDKITPKQIEDMLLGVIKRKNLKIEELKNEIELIKNDENNVYRERDMLVSHLSKVYTSYLGKDSKNAEYPQNEFSNIVYIDSPKGQLSWHIKDTELPLFSHLKYDLSKEWDGHTTDEKYQRLLSINFDTDNGEQVINNG